jgi:hypothetical protein
MIRPVALLAVATVCVTACSLLQTLTTAERQQPHPIDIPTSAVVAPNAEVVKGEIRLDGPCLYLDSGGGEHYLPIWPLGFNALAGPRFLGLRNAPDDQMVFAAMSEQLELHGQSVDVPPPDAAVPIACANYMLFHVRTAFNRS